MPPSFASEPGQIVGDRYELVRPIASGGMAQVWEGRDSLLNRPVAIKILHPHLATDRAFLLRFRREAIAAARLSHPSIVAIYDTVSEGSTEAIVMELIRGETLRSLLNHRGNLPTTDVVQLGLQIGEALGQAHRAGIIHRDIKPSNILVCSDQRVVVTDFGIAKAGEDTDLTVTGTLLGTAKYLSPEQVNGDNVDPRSDLYSLGVVLFEASTGRPPFSADTDAATALARLHQDQPWASKFCPGINTDLENIIFKLMERDPQARFANAQDLGAALSGVRAADTTHDQTTILSSSTQVSTNQHSSNQVNPNQPHNERLSVDLDQDEFDEYDSDDYDDGESGGFLRSERSWMLPALALCLVAAGLLVAGALISGSKLGTDENTSGIGQNPDSSIPKDNSTTLSRIDVVVDPTVSSAEPVDFEGDGGGENDHLAPLAYDDDDDTAWRTESYRRPLFGGLKPGLGFLVDLGGYAKLTEVELETNSDNWSISFFLIDSFLPDQQSWGEPIFVATNESGREKFDVSGNGRYLLLWITNPGTSEDGPDEDDEDDHRFELAEIRVS